MELMRIVPESLTVKLKPTDSEFLLTIAGEVENLTEFRGMEVTVQYVAKTSTGKVVGSGEVSVGDIDPRETKAFSEDMWLAWDASERPSQITIHLEYEILGKTPKLDFSI